MLKPDDSIKSREGLIRLLQKVSTEDLVDALSVRKEVIALRQAGIQVLMVPQ